MGRRGIQAWKVRVGRGSRPGCPSVHSARSVTLAHLLVPGWFSDPICARAPSAPDKRMGNVDMLPVPASLRTFNTYDMAALWVGLVISVPSYQLAGMMVQIGMGWAQALGTVFLGNAIVLVPMVLMGSAGTKWGVPFPVLARASFGVRGTHVPSAIRGLVACGWFGINTWIGGKAIATLLRPSQLLTSLTMPSALAAIVGPGVSADQLAGFSIFWAVQAAILVNGIESIKRFEELSAPVLVLMTLALVAWALSQTGGQVALPVGSAPPSMPHFLQALTANVAYWATLAINIPDFTRYAVSQKSQAVGQAVGLPLVQAAFSFAGLVVTSATVVLYGGSGIADPVALLSTLDSSAFGVTLALAAVVLTGISTNVAANVVAPANALVNVDPENFRFRESALLCCSLGLLMQPWRLMADSSTFMDWLVGYSVFLGPIGAIMLVDYFGLQGRHLDVDALYSLEQGGAYYYAGGYNPSAMLALVIGCVPSLPGFLHSVGLLSALHPIFHALYSVSWFVGFVLGGAAYCVATRMTLLDHPHLD